MGRRASSSLNGPAIAGIVVVLLILLGAGAILLRGKKDTFTGTPLPIEDIYSGANSLRGNEYTWASMKRRIRSTRKTLLKASTTENRRF